MPGQSLGDQALDGGTFVGCGATLVIGALFLSFGLSADPTRAMACRKELGTGSGDEIRAKDNGLQGGGLAMGSGGEIRVKQPYTGRRQDRAEAHSGLHETRP